MNFHPRATLIYPYKASVSCYYAYEEGNILLYPWLCLSWRMSLALDKGVNIRDLLSKSKDA